MGTAPDLAAGREASAAPARDAGDDPAAQERAGAGIPRATRDMQAPASTAAQERAGRRNSPDAFLAPPAANRAWRPEA